MSVWKYLGLSEAMRTWLEKLLDPDIGIDDEFLLNDQQVAREVYCQQPHLAGDTSIVCFQNFHLNPRCCRAIHRPIEGGVLFAIGHVQGGGALSEHIVLKLATHLRQKYYPEIPPDKIKWFEIDGPTDREIRIRSIRLLWTGSRYGSMSPSTDVPPEDFKAEINRVYQEAKERGTHSG